MGAYEEKVPKEIAHFFFVFRKECAILGNDKNKKQ